MKDVEVILESDQVLVGFSSILLKLILITSNTVLMRLKYVVKQLNQF